MSNQEMFEIEAKALLDRNQAMLDLKLYLSHWSGYKEIDKRHKKELQDLAQKYSIELDLKKWKLNLH